MMLIAPSTIINIPRDVAVCPYCEAALSVSCDTWEEMNDGTWQAEHIECLCHNEPEEMDSKEWDEWLSVHSDMPYVYQLPVDLRVLAWVNARYRWDLSG